MARKRSRRRFGSIVVRKGRGRSRGKESESVYVRYRDGDGKVRFRSVGPNSAANRRYAESILAELHALKIKERATGERTITPITLDEFWPQLEPLLRARQRATTLRAESRRYGQIADHFGKRYIKDLKLADLNDWVAHLRTVRGNAPATVNRFLALLSVTFQAAVERGYAKSNVARQVKRQKEAVKPIPFLPTSEIDRLIKACPPDIRPIARLAVESGLRRGELAALDWADIDFEPGDHGVLTVRVSKSGKMRRVPLTERARRVLDELRERREPKPLRGPHLVFPEFTGSRVDRITRIFSRVPTEAGYTEITFHGLRHQFACHLARAGVELTLIGKLLGHSPNSPQMTLRYAAHSPQGADYAAIKLLDQSREGRVRWAPRSLQPNPGDRPRMTRVAE